MTRPSLAFATDVAARLLEGGVLERHEGHRVVRTPANPAFRWGNFVLADAGADLTAPERWAAAHAAAFPGAGFVSIGVDEAEPHVDEAAWTAAGFTVEHAVVLEAPAARIAAEQPSPSVAVEEVLDDAGWADVLAIELELGPPDDPASAPFATARVAAQRAATARGLGVWLGARPDARIVSALGLYPLADGVARYQNVGTLSRARRQGLAGALVRAGARAALERGRTRLVIVADPDGPAIALYRRLGFTGTETQVQLTRLAPPA
ncbi:GNAT family N-acetyltransferase [Amnibacterium sp. CER49]|uniref:GNAT family N-acetyltransferase n=1 Tax=Amnibacterium sp. CER49 TaxID=3039161 RepID=UPI0024475F7F|nr:GNAT family N-acetyltransferase [Amnibacterium sp. CER49]MDH2445353.1 GNAT family N-acetyltransferase [Amnibacterium sp. CER49]